MPPYFCDKERVCVKTDCVDCENDCLCVNVCVLSKMFALDVMSCVCYVGRGVFGFFPSEAQKRKVLGFFFQLVFYNPLSK